MITDDQVSAALAYLADDEAAAKTFYDATMAENRCEEAFARLFLENEGSVDARKMAATIDPLYQRYKDAELHAKTELKRHQAKINSANMILEIWRTENANARAAERVR